MLLVLQIYMCRSGSAADTQNLCSYVQYYLNQHCMSSGRDADVKTAAKLAQLIAYNNKVCIPKEILRMLKNLNLILAAAYSKG